MLNIELLATYRDRLARTLPEVRERIAAAAQSSGRGAGSVRLVAVTKGHPLEAVRAALECGLPDLGENRVEEMEAKALGIGAEGVHWHLIGHVQSRKVKRALAVADLIHSVDSLRLAERISRSVAEEGRPPVRVLLQVNTSGEVSKGGFEWPSAGDEVPRAAALDGLVVEGLMTMAPFTDDEGVVRGAFRALREALGVLRRANPRVGGELSMGMTGDLEIAVEEGSTMVRIGTALFGERV